MRFLKLLRLTEWYNGSENIEIAKGKYQLPTNWKKGKNQIKRAWHRKRRSY